MKVASRVMMVMKAGKPIPPGLVAMHSCDNPFCVNPAHLSLGTLRDNGIDAARKGRNTTSLSRDEVLAIVHALRAGETQMVIATRFDVCQRTVGFIARGEAWSWLTGIKSRCGAEGKK